MTSYPQVDVRLLTSAERSFAGCEETLPLVIAARERTDLAFLHAFTRANGRDLVADAARYGAILFRGFDVADDADFERTVLAIDGMRGIDRVFMPEEGRLLVSGQRFVLHTNAFYATGGTLDLGTFHTENWFRPDVPRYIFFCCHRPSWFGGETGMVDVAKVYASLPASRREVLEASPRLATFFDIGAVAAVHALPVEATRNFLRDQGMQLVECGGKEYALLYKPPVFINPTTGEHALAIHYWYALDKLGFQPAVRKAFLGDYTGAKWAVHRAIWKHPRLANLLPSLTWLLAPAIAARDLRNDIAERIRRRFGRDVAPVVPSGPRVHDALDAEDVERVAEATRRHYSSFRWQRGDVLMIDNSKVAHTGMPGFGPRTVRAMICNPLAPPLSPEGSGAWRVPDEPAPATTGEAIERLAAR